MFTERQLKVIFAVLKILPIFALLFLLSVATKQCQQNACDSNPMMCD
jgi:hypothetical protein